MADLLNAKNAVVLLNSMPFASSELVEVFDRVIGTKIDELSAK
jgi:hypothetical protein